jgi:hypothetical protein
MGGQLAAPRPSGASSGLLLNAGTSGGRRCQSPAASPASSSCGCLQGSSASEGRLGAGAGLHRMRRRDTCAGVVGGGAQLQVENDGLKGSR